ncbi:MAG: hypothetical protein ABI231_11385 [Candidatus Tumulicola sp.]
MKYLTLVWLVASAVGAVLAVAGCGGGAHGPAPVALSSPPLPTPTPAARRLYVDHDGTLYEYALPLTPASKPQRTLPESPGSGFAPQIAVDPGGKIAIASATNIRVFHPPIVSFAPSAARLTITLTPAITEMGPGGADLVDLEYDPNANLWLLNNLGGEVAELAAPISASSVAALTIGFGAPGSKTAGYSALIQARFDVSSALYVYANQSGTQRSRVFKISFPYAKPPSSIGLDLAQADFVDPSQYLPTNPNPAPLLLGQYVGPLSSPPPGLPPPPPVNELSQFAQPFNPVLGVFPDATAKTIVGALIADPPRRAFYTLDTATGRLDAYDLPLATNARPKISLACLGGVTTCDGKAEHLFLAP